jgi:DNA topoisomerase-3
MIRAFKPEPFWELFTLYREVTFKFTGDRFTKEEAAREALDRVQGHPFTVQAVDKKEERELPPQLHDLTELQREMNRRHGLSADATLKAAQALYEAKLITYPRTDSRYLTTDLKGQIPGILEQLRPLKPTEIGRLDLQHLAFTGRIVNDAKVGDHHAILPTGKRPGELPPAQHKVFDAVVTRLIAAFYPACVKEVTTVAGESNGVPFRARGVPFIRRQVFCPARPLAAPLVGRAGGWSDGPTSSCSPAPEGRQAGCWAIPCIRAGVPGVPRTGWQGPYSSASDTRLASSGRGARRSLHPALSPARLAPLRSTEGQRHPTVGTWLCPDSGA